MSDELIELGIWLFFIVILVVRKALKSRRIKRGRQLLTSPSDYPRSQQAVQMPPAPPPPPQQQVPVATYGSDADAVSHLAASESPMEETPPRKSPTLPGTGFPARDAVIWGELLRRKF